MASNMDTLSDNTKKLISICKKDGTERIYEAIITSTDEAGGEKAFDSITTQGGGRLKNYTPQTDYEVTLEGYAVEVGTLAAGTTGNGFNDLMSDYDGTSQPVSIINDHTREEYRLVIMRTSNFTQASASAVTTTLDKAVRWTYENGHFTNVVASDTDNVVKFTLSFKTPAFNKAGTKNRTVESTDGTAAAVLPELAAYATA